MKIRMLPVVVLVPALGALGQSAANDLSPAQQNVEWARKAIERDPRRYQAYNDLGLALARRARETSNTSYYTQAEEALKQSFALAPDNFEGQKVQVWILLGKHEFAQARERATALNKRVPDDLSVYGFLVDANVELGDYEEAEKAAQWLLNLRPGNVPGLTRGAYLRELFGDIDGALEFMSEAYQSVSPNETEDRAWILTQMAHLKLVTGEREAAEKLAQQALEVFPSYHYALASLAKVRTAQGQFAEAVELLRERYQATGHAENLYDLAEALARAGHAQEAEAAYAEFERIARQEIERADNSNRELIFYYADRAHKPAEALRLARLEFARRHDIHTRDANAWALYANRDYAEARRQLDAALAVGVRDAKLLYHAGAIASKLGDRASATRLLKQSLGLNPFSESSAAAQELLATLAPLSTDLSAHH